MIAAIVQLEYKYPGLTVLRYCSTFRLLNYEPTIAGVLCYYNIIARRTWMETGVNTLANDNKFSNK